MKNFTKNVKYILFILFVGLILFMVVELLFTKTNKIENDIYSIKANELTNRLNTLIQDKSNATSTISLMLSQNLDVKKLLLTKYIAKETINLYSQLLKDKSEFKNVWIQIIDRNGVSQYRSWTKNKNDKISEVRNDVKVFLNNPKLTNSISVGRYDMTFKSMAPIYHNDELIGIIEVITHFNSIVKTLQSSGVETVVLVNEKYTKQLKEPFTNIFIDRHYVANLYNPKEILDFIKNNGVKNFWAQNGYKIIDDRLVTFYKIYDNQNDIMATFVLIYDLKNINLLEVKSLEFMSTIITISFFVIFLLLLFYVISSIKRKEQLYKNEILSKNNELLEERVELELKKNRKKDLLLLNQSKYTSLAEMLENIAHQWRQPLSVISTSISGLAIKKEMGILEDDEFKEYVNVIIKNTKYLSNTIDSFKKFLTNDQENEYFEIYEVFDDTYKLLKPMLDENSIKVFYDIDINIKMRGSKSDFSHILLNLFNNSKESLLQKNEDKRIIHISCVKKDKDVEICFCDSGKGLEEELFEKVFEPFYTTKHQSFGTGLGLFTSREILHKKFDACIVAMNSSFNYEDKEYKGACFKIILKQNF